MILVLLVKMTLLGIAFIFKREGNVVLLQLTSKITDGIGTISFVIVVTIGMGMIVDRSRFRASCFNRFVSR